MNNQIDELLGEISKFKTNVANSNELLELLKATNVKIDEHEELLKIEHEQVLKNLQQSIIDIESIIMELDTKVAENKSEIQKTTEVSKNIFSKSVFQTKIIIGLLFLIFVNIVVSIINSIK
jgi:hypothetical protein